MGEYTSTVTLTADVSDAVSKLEDVERMLRGMKNAKITVDIDSKDLRDLNSSIKGVSKALTGLSDDLKLNEQVQELQGMVDDLQNKFSKINLKNLDDVGIKDINEELSKSVELAGELGTALNGSSSGGSGTGSTQKDIKNVEKDAKNAQKSVTGLNSAVKYMNDLVQNGTGQNVIGKRNQEIASYSGLTEYSEYVDKMVEANDKWIESYNEIKEITQNGQVDALTAMRGNGSSDEDIVKRVAAMKDYEAQYKNYADMTKRELTEMTAAQKDFDKYMNSATSNNYQNQLGNIQKSLEDFSKLDTKELTTYRTELQGFYDDINTLQQNAQRNGGKVNLDELMGVDGWSKEKILGFSDSIKTLGNEVKTFTGNMKSAGVNNSFLDKITDGSYVAQINNLKNSISQLGDSEQKAALSGAVQGLEDLYSNMQAGIASGTAEGYKQAAQDAAEFTARAKEAYQEYRQFMSGASSAGGGGNFTGGGGGTTGGNSWFSDFASDLSGSMNTAAQVLNRIAGYNAIYREIRQIAKDMVNTVTEIDTAMTQLQIVTGASESEMNTFFESSISQAKELGQSVTDILDTIQVYSRLGYDLADSSELAKYTSILSNVAAVDVDEATTGLTSVIKGFDLEVSDAEHVADVLIDIGQNYAVSASEILEAFTHSSAAFGATGTTFEEAAAVIAAGNAAVQDASTVGTALKTVSARIRRSTTELDELGESYDDLAGGFAKYRDELLALTGFDIMEEGSLDDFKSIYDIFDGISKVWGDLTETQQSRVSEILGGTRQLQVISSIINNWDDAASAYAEAMDSAGVATQAQATWMTSLQAEFCLIVQKCAIRTHLIAGNA